MKLSAVAVVMVLLCGMLSTSFADDSLAKALHRMRCKNNWDCQKCDRIKRQGRCHSGYLMGVCYKTCTGCDPYFDKAGYDCPTIKKEGKCFSRTKDNPYITYASRCEASCCQAYPLSVPSTKQSKTSPPTTLPTTTSSPPRTYWYQWSSWSPCSKTCHIGQSKRTRTCSYSQDPRVNCSRPQSQYRYCNQNVTCGVDGGYNEWSQWGQCSFTCGTAGMQRRKRTCTNPPPQNGGRDCVGPNSETKDCYRGCCPEFGEWSVWSAWSTCSKTCCSSTTDYGTMERKRSCTNPPPYCGGPPCDGPSSQSKPCLSKVPCGHPTEPPSTYWSSWGPWEPCSATCYLGYRAKRRKCIGYQGNNEYCDGLSTKYELCNTDILC